MKLNKSNFRRGRAKVQFMAVVALSTISVCGADMGSYVQDGLVAMFDGLYNNITESGTTNHAVGVQTWCNLVTGRKTELSAGSVIRKGTDQLGRGQTTPQIGDRLPPVAA